MLRPPPFLFALWACAQLPHKNMEMCARSQKIRVPTPATHLLNMDCSARSASHDLQAEGLSMPSMSAPTCSTDLIYVYTYTYTYAYTYTFTYTYRYRCRCTYTYTCYIYMYIIHNLSIYIIYIYIYIYIYICRHSVFQSPASGGCRVSTRARSQAGMASGNNLGFRVLRI